MLSAALAVIALLGPPAGAGRALVFTRTEGFRHGASIAAGLTRLRADGARRGLRVEATDDPRRLSARGLRGVRALVFLHTTGDVLDPAGERAVERFVRSGGGWLGIHAAADAEASWAFHRSALLGGARFLGHPPIQRATVVVEDRSHPATRHLPRRWSRTDEWYSFGPSPRGPARVVASLDERTYDPGRLRTGDHPIAWWRRAGRGRVFYTALGHTTASWDEPAFRRHVAEALRWVAGS